VAQQEGALGVDRHDRVPLLGRYLDGWSQSLAHGYGVGQDIKTTVLLAREGDEGAGQQLGGPLAWVLEHLPENPAVDQLAAIAMMSRRTFYRNSSPQRVPRRTAG